MNEKGEAWLKRFLEGKVNKGKQKDGGACCWEEIREKRITTSETGRQRSEERKPQSVLWRKVNSSWGSLLSSTITNHHCQINL